MKKAILLLLLLSIIQPFNSISQSKKDLKYEVYKLEKKVSENQSLKEENEKLKLENERLIEENKRLNTEISWRKPSTTVTEGQPNAEDDVRENDNSTGQCKAITAKGTQCSRKAEVGGDYCWQHKGYSGSKSTVKSSGSSSQTSTGSGRTIQTGSRGGKYYINKNGNKTYIKR